MAKVIDIVKNSFSYKAGLRKNDEVIAIDGNKITDCLDLLCLEDKTSFSITIKKGESYKIIDIVKPQYEEVDFNLDLYLEPRECDNHCIFCFVDQLPCNMRESLYVKDDDYRLSMICGSYITLTNLNEEDIQRIITLKISPLYISIHAYNDKVRRKLLGNVKADRMMEIIQRFYDNNIVMHMQVVVVEKENSGEILIETIEKMHSLYPVVRSIAVVPVGITEHREKLYKIEALSYQCVKQTIEDMERLNNKYKADTGSGFVWCSDEFYIKMGAEIPADEYYESYPQIDNGVGLVRQFLCDLEYALSEYKTTDSLVKNSLFGKAQKNNGSKHALHNNDKLNNDNEYPLNNDSNFNDNNKSNNGNEYPISDSKKADTYIKYPVNDNNKLNNGIKQDLSHIEQSNDASEYALITGVSFFPYLSQSASVIYKKTAIKCAVYEIKNTFLGKDITVAGLICGKDLIEQLKGKIKQQNAIIPKSMLKEFSHTFLDGLSVCDIENELNIKIFVVSDALELVRIISSIN